MIKLDAYRPEIKDWISLEPLFESKKNNSGLPVDLSDTLNTILSDKELFEIIRTKSFHKMNDLDLVMIVGSPLWDDLNQSELKQSAKAFWSFCSKNTNVGERVYYWYLKNTHAFNKHLSQAAKAFKNHSGYFEQCVLGQFYSICREMMVSDLSPENFCKKNNLPFTSLLKMKEFRESIAKAFWFIDLSEQNQVLSKILQNMKKDDQYQILLSILQEKTKGMEYPKLDKSLKEKFLNNIPIEDLTSLDWRAKFWGVTDQLVMEDAKKKIQRLSSSDFIRYGFPNIPDKHNEGEIIHKRWLIAKFDFAAKCQVFFQYTYLFVEQYYLPILDIHQGKPYVKEPVFHARKNFIFLCKPNGSYVILFLPRNIVNDTVDGAIIGEVESIKNYLDSIKFNDLNYLTLLERSKWSEKVEHGANWKNILAEKMLKRGFIKEQLTNNQSSNKKSPK